VTGTTTVHAKLLRQGNTLALTFPNQRPLKLSKRPHNVQEQVRHRVVIARERELLFHELNPDLLRGKPAHDQAKVIQVAGQPVHGMSENSIAVSDELDHLLQLGPVLILPRRPIMNPSVDS
jgi:hypothetical protein